MTQQTFTSPVADSLDDRMKAAGMFTVAQLLAGAPLDAFVKHAGVHDIASFGQWAEMRRAEFLTLSARYELGDKPKDDLYEWVLAHSAVFSEVHVNLKAALAGESPEQLYAVHAQGPDDLYAAMTKVEAEQHANEMNDVTEGLAHAVVIPSPWAPVEHWKTYAEQAQHQIEDMRAAYAVHGPEIDMDAIVASIQAAARTLAPAEPAIEYAYAKAAPSDNWSNDSLASVVSDNDLKAGDVIQRGVTSKSTASSFLPDIDDVVNHMANQASSESEFADHFPDLTDKQQDELDTLMEPMRAWVDKNCDVRFYEVSKIEPYTITDADVAAGEAYKAQLETLV